MRGTSCAIVNADHINVRQPMFKSYPQLFACLLALGGLFWAFFLSVAAVARGWNGILGVAVYFGLGYLIWAGWIVRAFHSFKLSLRVTLWTASILYNGSYFVRAIGGFRTHTGELPLYWWGIASVMSVIALFLEVPEMPNQSTDLTPASGTPPAGQESRHP